MHLSTEYLKQSQQRFEDGSLSSLKEHQRVLEEISAVSMSQVLQTEKLSDTSLEVQHRNEVMLRGIHGLLTDGSPRLNMPKRSSVSTPNQPSCSLQISVSQYICDPWCSCNCHKPSRFESPRILSQIIG